MIGRIDALIRFLYSRLELNKYFFWSRYSSDYALLDSCFESMKNTVFLFGFDFRGKICLEIGPGNSLINAYNFLMNGAEKVILVDKYSRVFETKKQKDFYARELDYVRRKYSGKDLFFLKGNEINEKFIDRISCELLEVDLNVLPDFIYSVDVLEHIRLIEDNISNMGKILKKEGMMYHQINLRDHYDPSQPFLFLKYSKETWENFLVKEGVSYTNRVRYSQFREMFEKSGFDILSEDLKRFSMENAIVSEEFDENDEYLNVGTCKVLCQKKLR
jgi:SAM-dependent methyltransferase